MPRPVGEGHERFGNFSGIVNPVLEVLLLVFALENELLQLFNIINGFKRFEVGGFHACHKRKGKIVR